MSYIRGLIIDGQAGRTEGDMDLYLDDDLVTRR